MLGVRRDGLPRPHAEERRVELSRTLQEAALAGVRGAGAVRIGVVEPLRVPAPVPGEAGHRVRLLGHQPPQRLRRVGAAREAAPHRHDRDRLVLLVLQLLEPAPGLPEIGRGPFQVVAELVLVTHRHRPLVR